MVCAPPPVEHQIQWLNHVTHVNKTKLIQVQDPNEMNNDSKLAEYDKQIRASDCWYFLLSDPRDPKRIKRVQMMNGWMDG